MADASVLALTVGFPNSAAVALPLLTAAYGPGSRVTAALSIAVGAITISPLTVALLESDKLSDGKGISIQVKRLRSNFFAHSLVLWCGPLYWPW